MKISGLNEWLTLLANLGVIAGIVFLAIEVSQNTKTMQADTYQSRSSESTAFVLASTQSETLASALSKTNYYSPEIVCAPTEEQLSSLSEIEMVAYSAYIRASYIRIDNQVYQYEQGLLDESFFNERTLGGLARLVPLLDSLVPGMASSGREILEEHGFNPDSHACGPWL